MILVNIFDDECIQDRGMECNQRTDKSIPIKDELGKNTGDMFRECGLIHCNVRKSFSLGLTMVALVDGTFEKVFLKIFLKDVHPL